MKSPNAAAVTLTLLILFLTLRCYGITHWPMWVVFSPVWVLFLTSFIEAVAQELKDQKRNRRR